MIKFHSIKLSSILHSKTLLVALVHYCQMTSKLKTYQNFQIYYCLINIIQKSQLDSYFPPKLCLHHILIFHLDNLLYPCLNLIFLFRCSFLIVYLMNLSHYCFSFSFIYHFRKVITFQIRCLFFVSYQPNFQEINS